MCRANNENALELDFGAMDFSTPRLTLSSSIGNGVNYMSKFMSSKLSGSSEAAKPLLDYLLALNHQGEVGVLTSAKDDDNDMPVLVLEEPVLEINCNASHFVICRIL
jgi:sucrose synthase